MTAAWLTTISRPSRRSLLTLALMLAVPGTVGISVAQSQRGPGDHPHRQGPPRDQGGGNQGGDQGNPDQGPSGRRGPTSRPSPDQLFDRADANHDGVLSREEFKQFVSAHRPPPPPSDGNEGGDNSDDRRPQRQRPRD